MAPQLFKYDSKASSEKSYEPVPSDDDSELATKQQFPLQNRSRAKFWIILWVVSLIGSNYITWYVSEQMDTMRAVRHLEGYSPLHDKLNIHMVETSPNGSVWDNPESIWRQDPSDEVDAAWEEIGFSDPIFLTKEEVIKLGKNPDISVQWPMDPTGNTYVGSLDLFHKLHCLNALREGLWKSYYRTSPVYNPTDPIHWSHCIDSLRQELMCTASMKVITMEWNEFQNIPFPDFVQENRKCRKWEDVMEWKAKYTMNREDAAYFGKMTRPDNVTPRPIGEEGWKLLKITKDWQQAVIDWVKHKDDPGYVYEGPTDSP